MPSAFSERGEVVGRQVEDVLGGILAVVVFGPVRVLHDEARLVLDDRVSGLPGLVPVRPWSR